MRCPKNRPQSNTPGIAGGAPPTAQRPERGRRPNRALRPLCALFLLLSAGCNAMRVDIDTYVAREALEGKAGRDKITLDVVALIPNTEAENPLFEEELLDQVGALLEQRGVSSVAPAEATYGLIASTSLDDPGGGGTANFITSPGGVYFSNYGGYRRYGYGGFGTRFSSRSQPYFTTELSLVLFELAPFIETGEWNPIWIGNARHGGRSSDLRSVAKAMVKPLVDYLGVDTGRQIRLKVDP